MNKSIGGVVADLKKYALQHLVKTSLAVAALVGVAVFYQNCGLERPQVDLTSMGQLGYFAHTGKEQSCVPCHEARRPNAAAVPSILNVAINKSPNRFSHVDAYNGASDCVYCHANDTKKIGNTWVASGYYDHTDNTGAYVTSCKDCHTAPLATPSTTPSIMMDHATDAGVIAAMATANDCATCHTKPGSSWLYAARTHNLVADSATMCFTCHIGKMPTSNVVKPTAAVKNMFFHNSIAVGTAKTKANDCIRCHTASAAGFPAPIITDWAGGVYDHKDSTGVTVTACATCHGTATSIDRPQPAGTLVGPTAYQFNHTVFETKECSTCHKTTTRGTGTPWNDGKYTHLPMPTSCNGCHDQNRPLDVTQFITRPTASNPLLASQSATSFYHKDLYDGLVGDCYGCHTNNKAVIGKVGGWVGSGYYDHTNKTGTKITTCKECHVTPTSIAKFDHTAVAGAGTECISCHTSPGVSWAAAGAHAHSSGDTGKCMNCHKGDMPNSNLLKTLSVTKNFFTHDVLLYLGVAPAAAPYPNDCSRCHKTQYGVSWATGDFDHKLANTTAGGVVTAGALVTSCIPCHTKTTSTDRPVGVIGFNLNGPLGVYKYNHVNGLANATATDYADCASCHKAPAATPRSWANGNYTHSPTPLACVACHKQVPLSTTQLPASKTTVDRVYFHNVLYNGTSDCVACHTATILNVGSVWSGAVYNHTSAGTTPVATCLACHSASVDRVNVAGGTVDGFVHDSAKYTVTDCKGCHTSKNTNTTATLVGGFITANAGWKPATWSINAHKTVGGAAVTTCLPCHSTRGHNKGRECYQCHKQPGVRGWPNQ